jgi:O-acetyl-ADP-ribose deacetylase (regulator of RNase III)
MNEVRYGATTFVLAKGDITEQVVDVIVNAANSSLLGGGGVDGAIHRKGGPAILAECKQIRARQGGCPTGEAVITGAGRLQAKHVVHTVGPVWPGGGPDGQEVKEAEALLASCYRNSLRLAASVGTQTIAFPSISTGIYGYPIEQAAPVALRTVREVVLAENAVDEVRFILFSDADLAVYQQVLLSLER